MPHKRMRSTINSGSRLGATIAALFACSSLLLVFASTASAALSGQTEAATGVVATKATLHATLYPHGSKVTYGFQYGTSTEYGHTTPIRHIEAGTEGAVEVSETIEGLEPATTYHFMVGALGGGAVIGEDLTFTTGSDAVPTTAFQDNGGTLWTKPIKGGQSTGWVMDADSSPSIDTELSGAYEVAFQAANNELWTYSSEGERVTTGLGMMSGSSPAIAAAISGGSYVTAFQGYDGNLWYYVPSGTSGNTMLGMMESTSPSIAALSEGGYVVAFQDNGGNLWTKTSEGASSTGLQMGADTSPSVAALPGGGYVVAFQDANGVLRTYSSVSGSENTGQEMKAGTSPSIATDSDGNYQIAFQAPNTELSIYSSESGHITTGLGMSLTSPSISTLPDGGYATAFQANTGYLWVYAPTGTSGDTALGMMESTSPSLG